MWGYQINKEGNRNYINVIYCDLISWSIYLFLLEIRKTSTSGSCQYSFTSISASSSNR